MTYAPIQGKCPVCHQDSANTSFKAGAESRDAEVAELKEDATDFHGQINRLTEWNNNLVSHRDELKSELFDLTKQRDALSRIADTLEQERDQLREQVTLLRDAILRTCCNSEGVVCLRGSYDGRTILQEALAATKPERNQNDN